MGVTAILALHGNVLQLLIDNLFIFLMKYTKSLYVLTLSKI